MPETETVSRARLAADVGRVRIGIARSEAGSSLSLPVGNVARDLSGADADVREVARLAQEFAATEVIVGLPVQLDGTEGLAAADARRWAENLGKLCGQLEIRMVDERLTTAYAHKMLRSAGRSERDRRSVIDQAAAVAILDTVLDAERRGSKVPGTVLGVSPRRARKPRARQKDSDA